MRLGDVCTKIGSGATPKGGKEAYKPSGIPLIRSQNVLDWLFTSNGLAFVDEGQAAALANVEVEPRDILLNITGDSVARACMVPDWCTPARVNQHVSIVRPGPDLDPTFLLCFLQSSKPLLLKLASSGATRNALTKGMIGDLEIELPNIETQRAIASLIGQIQQKIVLNQQTNDYLERCCQSLFDDIQNDRTNEVIQLSDVAAVNPKRHLTKGSLARCVEMANLSTSGSFPNDWCRKAYSGGMKFMNGDTILARITPCLENGKTAYINFLDEGEVAFGSTEYIVLASKGLLPAEFFYFLARNRAFVSYATNHMNGSSGRQRVSAQDIEAYRLRTPSSSQAARFADFVRPIMEEILTRSLENRRLSSLRGALLPKLLSGEIDVSKVEIPTPPNNHFGDCSLESSFQKPKER